MAPTILSLVARLPEALGDRRILVQSDKQRPLEALWASDDQKYAATKWIGSNPALVWLFDVLATGFDGRLWPRKTCPTRRGSRQKRKQRWQG